MLENKTVLVIDDESKNIFALCAVLEEENIKCITAQDGKEGISLLETHPEIDIILMDIMMPVMDGFEAINYLRNSSRFKDIPIIALTANAMKGDKEKCINAGASDYVSKPVNVEILKSKMRTLLIQKASNQYGKL